MKTGDGAIVRRWVTSAILACSIRRLGAARARSIAQACRRTERPGSTSSPAGGGQMAACFTRVHEGGPIPMPKPAEASFERLEETVKAPR